MLRNLLQRKNNVIIICHVINSPGIDISTLEFGVSVSEVQLKFLGPEIPSVSAE